MRQNVWDCYNHPHEYPYEVHYKTEKQKNEKHRYFQSLEQVKQWARKHKTSNISAASWQVFSIMEGLR